MRDDEFGEWLEKYTSLQPRPRSDAKSRCRRIERYKGNLDSLFILDKLKRLLEEFTYTRNDELNGIEPPISIGGKPVNGIASLKNAIKLYSRFCIDFPPNDQPIQECSDTPPLSIINDSEENTQLQKSRENVDNIKTVSGEQALQEQHFKIAEEQTGHTYESIVGPYLINAKTLTIQEPYIRDNYQIQNFVRFCETIVRLSSIQEINLITKFDNTIQQHDVLNKLRGLQQTLLEKRNIYLNIQVKPNIHAREIKIDSGWIIKIDRGLHFYQRPDDYFGIGINDFTLRPCMETFVDIFRGQ
jgi:hypothetical protein